MDGEKLIELLRIYEKAGITVFLLGRYGIGKSSVVYEYARRRAEELGKKLVIWHQTTEEEKKRVLEHPEKYYILVDIKGSMISLDNLIIPIIDKEMKTVDWIVPTWIKVFENEKASGVLFIDELNMTASKLQALLFELLLQRKIANVYLRAKDLLIIGAGNPSDVNEIANVIPEPLRNRMAILNADELLLNVEGWIKWANENNIHPLIIDYVLYKKNIWSRAKGEWGQATTPRSLEMLSKTLYIINTEKEFDKLELLAKSLLEEHDALEFIAFVKMYNELKDLTVYIKEPERLKTMEEQKVFIIGLKLTEMYLANEINVKDYLKVLEVIANRIGEYALTMLKYIKDIAKKPQKLGELVNEVIKDKNNRIYQIINDVYEFSRG